MGYLKEAWDLLTEGLNKPIYSDREAFQEKFKDSSQIAKETSLESPHITFDPFGSYVNNQIGNTIVSLGSNYNECVKKWREMANLPEVDEAISEITSEAICFDEIDDVVGINLDNIEISENIKTKIRESFDKILYLLDFNEKGEELFRQWYVDATLTLEVVYNNRKPKDGVQRILLLPPFNIFKMKNTDSAEIRWFVNTQPTYNIVKDFENAEKVYLDEQITQITSGFTSPDKRMYQSFLNKAAKVINQLYLVEDTLIIYRLNRSTEKRVFKIDTGNLPKSKAEEYVRSLMNRYRQKKVYNIGSGQLEDQSKSISILEDFWFPVSSSSRGTTVDTLQGSSTNFGGFDDVNYLLDKVYKALNLPISRRAKEAKVTINNNIDIERDEMKFYKYIQKLRRRFNNMFIDLLKKDILARQIMSLEDWQKLQEKIQFNYADSNEISLFRKMQIQQVKMDAANAALTLIDQSIVSRKFIQKNILRLTDEEIEEIAREIALEGGPMGAAGGMDASAAMPADGSTPGYSETGSQEPPAEGAGTETTTPETPGQAPEGEAKTGRFKQKQREGISQDILDNLREGDIITNGKQRLLYEKGKFKKVD